MGVKGLQSFMERCCPEACVPVNLRDMARQHVATSQQDSTTSSHASSPTIVVDGMGCLRHWYKCRDWVCGGQWGEYMDMLKNWVEAFTSAGIRLVFFFDGVVKEQKRREWVKRRRRVNGEISKIFRHMKAHGNQPGRELFCLPSGLATFTGFALRSLGQEVFCSVQEADYEIASYAYQNCSMGILGQDTDFIVYDSAPYLSLAKLRLNSLTTVLYDRQRLCCSIGLAVPQLPLLACLLGNDVVSQEQMQHIRNEALSTYRINNPATQSGAPQDQILLAVSHLVGSVCGRERDETGLIPACLNLSASQREILKSGICSYLLPRHEGVQQGDESTLSTVPAFDEYVSPEVMKACREKHVAMEGHMVYCVLWEGVVECSNTLEDEDDIELLPQALVYRPCRQLIYGLLLLNKHHGRISDNSDLPAVREWVVYPGNPLQEPDIVHSVPVNLPCEKPSLDLLWFGSGPDVASLRLKSFLSIFDCLDFLELYGTIEDSLFATLCLVTYIALQVKALSQEDLDAYLSQAVCLRQKSLQEIHHIKLPFLCSRAVQLGSLYVRGLGHLLGANCASGCPLPSEALMPWHSFDGRLFHSKYLLAHRGVDRSVLLNSDSSCLSLFLCLREKLTEACRKRGRILQSSPNGPEPSHNTPPGTSYRQPHADWPPGGGESWEEGGGLQCGGGWRERRNPGRERVENEQILWERRGVRGMGRGHHFGPHSGSYHNFHDEGPQRMSHPPKQSGGRQHHHRGRHRLAPRWSQPPSPGT